MKNLFTNGFLAEEGKGAPAGSGVTAQESGSGISRKTVLTFVNTVVTMVKNGTSTAGGGLKIYDFPLGAILIEGIATDLTVTNAGGDASYLAALGTAAAGTDATLTSTEANIIASSAATVSSGTGTVKVLSSATIPAVGVPFDGRVTAIDLYLNAALNANGTGKESMVFNGKITMHWKNLS